jgi:ketosteroid isomerase-like protein
LAGTAAFAGEAGIATVSRMMTDEPDISDEEAVRRTITEYALLCDDGRFEEWGDLYTDDAVFTVMGQEHRGPAAIRAFIEKGQPPEKRSKHLCAPPLIDLAGDEARAHTDFIFVARTATGGYEVTSAGRYVDRLVRNPDRWRFAERHITFAENGLGGGRW